MPIQKKEGSIEVEFCSKTRTLKFTIFWYGSKWIMDYVNGIYKGTGIEIVRVQLIYKYSCLVTCPLKTGVFSGQLNIMYVHVSMQ